MTSGPKDAGSPSIFSPFGVEETVTNDKKIYPLTPEDLIGKTFVREDATKGDFLCIEMVRMLKQHAEDTHKEMKFLIDSKDGEQTIEHIMRYVELCDIVKPKLKQWTMELMWPIDV